MRSLPTNQAQTKETQTLRPRVGYVVKRYPRYSETFIVNEILAHEAAGLDVEIFSLYPPSDTHFQSTLARVKAPVTYLSVSELKASCFWETLNETASELPGVWRALPSAADQEARRIYQALQLAVLARRRNLTHLHAHFASSATTVTRMAATFAQLPYSFTAHAKDIFHESVDPADLRAKLQDATRVITVSDYNLSFLQEVYGDAARGVVRLYNGLELARFPFEAALNRQPVIVSVGRLVEKKGFADLIDACALLKREGRDFRCQIIGTGALEEELRAQIIRKDVQDTVELLGARPQDELADLLQGAAAFAAPCVVGKDGNRDGLPTVLLEAMALGTPCVSTDVTGIPELIRDGETGFQVPQHDPQALAAALGKLLDEAELRERLAQNARQLIEAEFDIHTNAKRLREVFEAPQPAAAGGVL